MPYRAKRHYSIVKGDKNHLTFAVKRDVTTEHEGEVSTILHDEFQEGDNINLTAPVGPFHVVEKGNRQLFLGSGIGVTPLVSMFNEVVNDNGEARFIQVTNDMDDAPFSSLLTAIANENMQATYDLYDKNKNGYIGSEQLKQWIDNDTEIYVCGGKSFIQSMIKALKELNIDESKIHYETFIPKLSVAV